MSARFDYIKYDEKALCFQRHAKLIAESFEGMILGIGEETEAKHFTSFAPMDRAKDNALKALEEVYMWVGKAIRDEQVLRSITVEPNESRDPNAGRPAPLPLSSKGR